MRSPTVSVITAAYNSSRTLRVALSSLLAQSFTDWEAWIIGDGCTDDSAAVVRSFGDHRLHWENLERNHGSQSFPNNLGLRRAKGTFVAYLGHDDLWLPNHLAELVTCIDANGADFVHSICGFFGPEQWDKACVGPPKTGLSYDHHFLSPSCWLHRRSLIDSIGYWSDPSNLSIPVDSDFLRRASRAGTNISFCPAFTVLKIVSARIRLYALKGAPPQETLWYRVQTDLEGLEHELLGQIATELAKTQWGGDEPLPVAIRRVAGILKRQILRIIGDYPPISTFTRWRYQRNRRTSNRLARGLPILPAVLRHWPRQPSHSIQAR